MGSPKHLSTTPSEGFGPSRRQTAPPKPLQSLLQTTLPSKLIRKTGFGRGHPAPKDVSLNAPASKPSEGLVEGRAVAERVG